MISLGAWRRVRAALIALVVASGATCVDTIGPSSQPTQIQIVAGNEQIGEVASELEANLLVRVLGPSGEVVRGALVAWEVGPNAGTITPIASRTNGEGLAGARWRLGTTAGAQTVTVKAAGVAPVTFTATALPGAPASLRAASGNDQVGNAGAILGAPLVVEVTDAHGNGVPGVDIHWTVVSGGGSVSPAVAVSDSNGRASTVWTLGPSGGEHQVQAAVAGHPPVIFTATSEVLTAASVEIVSGNGQFGPTGAQLPLPLVVRVTDQHGTPASGIPVQWSVDEGGGVVVPATVVTDAEGLAATFWMLGPNVGPGAVSARVAGVPGVTFTSTALAPVASVTIEPRGAAPSVDATVQLSAILRDGTGTVLMDGRAPAWSSSNAAVAQVDQDGRVIGIAPGSAYIRVVIEGRLDSIPVVVPPEGFTHTWLGVDAAQPDAWSVPANWGPSGIPGESDNVWIPFTPRPDPRLTVDASAGTIAVELGAHVDLNGQTLRAHGSVSAAGSILGDGELVLLGEDASLSGIVSKTVISGSVRLAGRTTAHGLIVGEGGSLDLAGQTLQVAGDLTVQFGSGASPQHGRIRLASDADSLVVAGNATFAGDADITAGTFLLRGDLTQSMWPTSLHAPALMVILDGSSPQTVTFQDTDEFGAHIGSVRVANPHGVTIARDMIIAGNLTVEGLLIVAQNRTIEVASIFLMAGGRIENHGTLRHNGLFVDHGGTLEGNHPVPAVPITQLTDASPVPLDGGAGTSTFFVLDVPGNVAVLRVSAHGGTGDLDLFVRRALLPSTEAHECASVSPGNDESCAINNPEAGHWFVLVTGAQDYSGATLEAEFDQGDGFNLQVVGLHINQAAQTFNGAVPLIAGRAGFLRVFVTAVGDRDVAPDLRVRFYRDGRVIRTDLIPAPPLGIPATLDTAEREWEAAYNLFIPGSLLEPGLSVRVDVDPNNAIPEGDRSDNAFPRQGTLMLDIRHVPSFDVRFVPMRHFNSAGQPLTGDVTVANQETYLARARELLPIHEVNASVAPVFSMPADFRLAGTGPGAEATWIDMLRTLDMKRVADGATEHYYGVVKPGYSSGVAGFGQIRGFTAVGWDGLHAATIAAHEWGHNFGRQHAPCPGNTNIGNLDTGYPYANGSIGTFGVNADTWPHLVRPDTVVYDVMSYCFTRMWVSDYTFRGILEYREDQVAGMLVAAAEAATGESVIPLPQPSSRGRRPSLVVWGSSHADTLRLEPAFRVETLTALPESAGAFTIEGFDAAG
ncbi:MAG TPA: Ig-like domain-containing protein, partial [Longimicrobiales bacterium]|nr:Ig-like domain-containing protein [Longimicrobiales bacterium]